MFNQKEAQIHFSGLIDDHVQSQKAEHRKWEGEDGFDMERMAHEPAGMQWWMVRQRQQLRPIYDEIVRLLRPDQELTPEAIEYLGGLMYGKAHQALSYFNHAARAVVEAREGGIQDMLLGEKRGKQLLADATRYTMRETNIPPVIEGLVIGRYRPDWLRVRLGQRKSDDVNKLHRVLGAGETTVQTSPAVQNKKTKFHRVAGKHYPYLFGISRVDYCIPDSEYEAPNTPGLKVIKGSYTEEDAVDFAELFYHAFKPNTNSVSIAELIPELSGFSKFRGVQAEQHAPAPSLITRLAQTYTTS